MNAVTLRQFAAHVRSLPAKIEAAVVRAENETADEARRLAVKASSGTHTLAALARAGHPYARRAPQRGKYPPGTVNAQTGKFRASWRVVRAVRRGNRIESAAENTDPKKRYLFGTSKMVPRTVRATVVTPDFIARRRARLVRELTKALKP